MGVKKITWDEAYDVAHLIADKAVEHIYKPIHEKKTAVATDVYKTLLARLHLSETEALLSAGVLKESKKLHLRFPVSEGADDYFTIEIVNSEDEKVFVMPAGHYADFYVHDEDLCEQLRTVYVETDQVEKQRKALTETLRSQLAGKSASSIMKTWPEAAQIVADYFCVDLEGKDTSMTVPLEALLSQFLTPLLAAPQGA